MKGPTIYDVAREAGVSIKTVSRVINGADSVREGTVARVKAAIEELDYHPNPAAQRLGGGRLPTIGVVVDSISDPFFAEVIATIEDFAMKQGMDVLVASTGMDGDRFRTQIRRLARRGVAGLVVAPVGDDETARRALPDDVPVVVIDRKNGIIDRDVVRATDVEGAAQAVRHLLAGGHRRIGFIGRTSQFSTVHDRYVGYETALAEAGQPIEPKLVETRPWTTAEAFPVALEMLDVADPPTAVFASTPMAGTAVLRAQQQLDRHDIALVIFGDFPTAELMTPPTTVVDQHPRALATTAFDLLARRMADPGIEILETVIRTTLIPRGSGELPGPEAET